MPGSVRSPNGMFQGLIYDHDSRSDKCWNLPQSHGLTPPHQSRPSLGSIIHEIHESMSPMSPWIHEPIVVIYRPMKRWWSSRHANPAIHSSISLLAAVGRSFGQLVFLANSQRNFLPRCTVRWAIAHPSVLIGYRSNISLLGGGYPFSSPLAGWVGGDHYSYVSP